LTCEKKADNDSILHLIAVIRVFSAVENMQADDIAMAIGMATGK